MIAAPRHADSHRRYVLVCCLRISPGTFGVPLLACPAVRSWYSASTSEQASSGTRYFKLMKYPLVLASLLVASAASGGESTGVDAAQDVAIRLTNDGAQVEVVGLPPQALTAAREAGLSAGQWTQLFTVAVTGDGATAGTSMIGKYAVDEVRIIFTPRFPLRPGLEYRACFNPAVIPGDPLRGAAKVEAKFALPRPPARNKSTVAAIYPSGDELPANLLRFYIHFSAPMSRGDSYQRIHIVEADGREVPYAFLELQEELWDADCKRLTVLFDPGRIKRGVKPNEEVGAPLVEGREYVLVIDADWPDAMGSPLAHEFRKSFRVTAPDDVQPDPLKWRIEAPPAGTRAPLSIGFDEPLDRALVERMLQVRDATGRELVGRVTVDVQETQWQFHPERPWEAGAYELVVDAGLEDRAGNSVGRAFETQGRTDQSSDAPVVVGFEIP